MNIIVTLSNQKDMGPIAHMNKIVIGFICHAMFISG